MMRKNTRRKRANNELLLMAPALRLVASGHNACAGATAEFSVRHTSNASHHQQLEYPREKDRDL